MKFQYKLPRIVIMAFFALTYTSLSAHAACSGTDKLCIMDEIRDNASLIDNKSWRDTTLRELAKSYTYAGQEDSAIALISDIETPDTQAMTIRGIGFAAADSKWNDKARYDALFQKLQEAAKTITHPPSFAIAYTYIAMAQAFAGDDAGATATAASMKNDALRNKAYGEAAEIQAELGKYDEAMKSIAAIDNLAFRNKAYATISGIFVNRGKLQEAYNAAQKIDNPYSKLQALQKITNHGNPEEN